MSRALGEAARFKEKVRTTGRAFMQWKMFAHFAHSRKLNEKFVERERRTKYLKKAWNCWMVNHDEHKNKKIEGKHKTEADSQIEMISMKYQKEISTLQTKLSEALAELHQVNQNKKEMQNQLKRAFMRGLCAMNLEAMDVLNPEDMKQLELASFKDDNLGMNFTEKNIVAHQYGTGTNQNQTQRVNVQAAVATHQQNSSNPALSSTGRLPQQNTDIQSDKYGNLPDFKPMPQPSYMAQPKGETNPGNQSLGTTSRLNQGLPANGFNTMDMIMKDNIKKDYPALADNVSPPSVQPELSSMLPSRFRGDQPRSQSREGHNKSYDYNQYRGNTGEDNSYTDNNSKYSPTIEDGKKGYQRPDEASVASVNQSVSGPSKAKPTDNIDDMYENMLKEYMMREENGKAGNIAGTQTPDEQRKVTILREPLVNFCLIKAESKEHLWRQAPVVGKRPAEEVSTLISAQSATKKAPIAHTSESLAEQYQMAYHESKPKSILKKKEHSSHRDNDSENDSEDEGQVLRFEPEELKRSQVSQGQLAANHSKVPPKTAPAPHQPASAATKRNSQVGNSSSSKPAPPSNTPSSHVSVSNTISKRIEKKNKI